MQIIVSSKQSTWKAMTSLSIASAVIGSFLKPHTAISSHVVPIVTLHYFSHTAIGSHVFPIVTLHYFSLNHSRFFSPAGRYLHRRLYNAAASQSSPFGSDGSLATNWPYMVTFGFSIWPFSGRVYKGQLSHKILKNCQPQNLVEQCTFSESTCEGKENEWSLYRVSSSNSKLGHI